VSIGLINQAQSKEHEQKLEEVGEEKKQTKELINQLSDASDVINNLKEHLTGLEGTKEQLLTEYKLQEAKMAEKESEFQAIIKLKLLVLLQKYLAKKEKYRFSIDPHAVENEEEDFYDQKFEDIKAFNRLRQFLHQVQNPYSFAADSTLFGENGAPPSSCLSSYPTEQRNSSASLRS
jgi:hypothetical protein